MTDGDDYDKDPPPGAMRWLVSTDESGIDGRSKFYGFGTLWMPWQRRGDFQEEVRALRERHRFKSEAKWSTLRPRDLPFYKDFVEFFFRTSWLMFHCLVVEKAHVDRSRHDNDMEVAWSKHLTMLLTNKIQRVLALHRDREQTFRIWVDPLPSSYAKEDEKMEIIANRVLAQVRGKNAVDKVITRDSATTPQIQLCDVLLGAIVGAWRQEATADAKVELSAWIARHLGWRTLRHDTVPAERKLNIWMFWDETRLQPRAAKTQTVKLRYPLPEHPPRKR